MFFYQQFLSSITLEVKPIVLGQEDTSYWHFDNIFCRLNGYRKVIILEAIYQQSEKVQYQRQLTTTVKTNIFQRQITNTRFIRCYAPPSQAPQVVAMPPWALIFALFQWHEISILWHLYIRSCSAGKFVVHKKFSLEISLFNQKTLKKKGNNVVYFSRYV